MVFQLFWSQIYGVWILAILVINRVWFLHSNLEFENFLLEEATLLSLSIRPSTKSLQLNIGLNYGTNYVAGLKQGIDLMVRSLWS